MNELRIEKDWQVHGGMEIIGLEGDIESLDLDGQTVADLAKEVNDRHIDLSTFWRWYGGRDVGDICVSNGSVHVCFLDLGQLLEAISIAMDE